MSEHTPLPWRQILLHPESILGAGQLAKHCFQLSADPIHLRVDPDGARALCEANAALIVAAVNAYPALQQAVEALQQIADHPETYDDGRRSYAVGWAFFNVQNIAKAALSALQQHTASAEGSPK